MVELGLGRGAHGKDVVAKKHSQRERERESERARPQPIHQASLDLEPGGSTGELGLGILERNGEKGYEALIAKTIGSVQTYFGRMAVVLDDCFCRAIRRFVCNVHEREKEEPSREVTILCLRSVSHLSPSPGPRSRSRSSSSPVRFPVSQFPGQVPYRPHHPPSVEYLNVWLGLSLLLPGMGWLLVR